MIADSYDRLSCISPPQQGFTGAATHWRLVVAINWQLDPLMKIIEEELQALEKTAAVSIPAVKKSSKELPMAAALLTGNNCGSTCSYCQHTHNSKSCGVITPPPWQHKLDFTVYCWNQDDDPTHQFNHFYTLIGYSRLEIITAYNIIHRLQRTVSLHQFLSHTLCIVSCRSNMENILSILLEQ